MKKQRGSVDLFFPLVFIAFFAVVVVIYDNRVSDKLNAYIAAHNCKEVSYVTDDDGDKIPVYVCDDNRHVSQTQIIDEM